MNFYRMTHSFEYHQNTKRMLRLQLYCNAPNQKLILIKIITGGLKRVSARRRVVAAKAFVFWSSEKKVLSVKLEVESEVLFVRFCKQRIHGCKNSVHCLVGLNQGCLRFQNLSNSTLF